MIRQTVMSWSGVTKHPHRFGGTEYCFGERREIGHIHGDTVVDIPFPIKMRDELIAAGRAELHHVRPEIGAVILLAGNSWTYHH
jgi:Luciferase